MMAMQLLSQSLVSHNPSEIIIVLPNVFVETVIFYNILW